MVLYRKGRMTKMDKIKKALERAKTIDDAYILLEPFNLTNEENCRIAQQWQTEQMILKVHGKGVFAEVA